MSVSSSASFHIHDKECIDARAEMHTTPLTGGYIVIEVGNSQVVYHGPLESLVMIHAKIGNALERLLAKESEVANA